MEEVRWDWIFEAVKADEGVVTFMIRRLVVVGVMPKRRKDSAICAC
jgi:hypothetical protein